MGGLAQVFEPIAQVIVRPDEPINSATVNEDAQSLVFDDTTLFEWNKFSGYDRFEGGTRANYGGQYTMTFSNGGYVNVLAGQSYQLAGRNSYATADAAAVGLESGLDTRLSDTVARLAVSPSSMFSFIAKGRFDSHDFDMRRLDLMANVNWGALETGLQYARYEAQPLIGYDIRREGLSATSKYKINPNYFVTGNVIFDLSRHLYNAELGGDAPLFFVAGFGLGAGYTDDCTTFSVNYTSAYEANQNGIGPPVRNQTVLVQLELRTLGDTKVRSGPRQHQSPGWIDRTRSNIMTSNHTGMPMQLVLRFVARLLPQLFAIGCGLVLSTGLLCVTAPAARAQSVIATVNDDPITDYDVQERMKLNKILQRPTTSDAALEDIIADRLKIGETMKFKIDPTDQDIGNAACGHGTSVEDAAAGTRRRFAARCDRSPPLARTLEGGMGVGRLCPRAQQDARRERERRACRTRQGRRQERRRRRIYVASGDPDLARQCQPRRTRVAHARSHAIARAIHRLQRRRPAREHHPGCRREGAADARRARLSATNCAISSTIRRSAI